MLPSSAIIPVPCELVNTETRIARWGTIGMILLSAACGRLGFGRGDGVDAGDMLDVPTLDIEFTRQQIGNLVVARASSASYVDALGKVQIAGPDQPRFDHDPVTHDPLGLAIESRHANLVLHSQDLSRTEWFSSQNMTATAAAAMSPDGTVDATRLDDQEVAGNSRRGQGVTIPAAAGMRYSFSIFIRAGTASTFTFSGELLGGTSFVQTTMTIDLGAGVVTQPPTFAVAYGIEPIGGGWYRVWITHANNASGNNSAVISVWSDWGAPAATGSLYVWGAQIEQGPRPSSYVPTTSTPVTRDADFVSAQDVTWLASDRGTLRVIASTVIDDKAPQPAMCLVATPPGRLCVVRNGGQQEIQVVSNSSATIVGRAWPTASASTTVVGWDAGGVALWDGASAAAIDPISIAAPEQAWFGRDGTDSFNGHLQRVTYWPRRFADDALSGIAAR